MKKPTPKSRSKSVMMLLVSDYVRSEIETALANCSAPLRQCAWSEPDIEEIKAMALNACVASRAADRKKKP